MNPRNVLQLMQSDTLAGTLAVLGQSRWYPVAFLNIEYLHAIDKLRHLWRDGGPRVYWYHAPVEYFFGQASWELFNTVREDALDDAWKVVSTTNAWIKLADYGGGRYSMLLDITNANYQDWLVAAYERVFRAAIAAPTTARVEKRLHLDRVESGISYLSGQYGNGSVDLDRDGSADNATTMDAAWRAGWIEFLDKLRAAGFSVCGNGGWNTHASYVGHMDHLQIEGFDLDPDTPGYVAASHSVAAQMKSLAQYGRDSFLMVRHNYTPLVATWRRRMRFAQCAALMLSPTNQPGQSMGWTAGNTTLPAVGYRTVQVHDYSFVDRSRDMTTTSGEWGEYLGPALGYAVNSSGTRLVDVLASSDYLDAEDSVWQREFRHGGVDWNPTSGDVTLHNARMACKVRGLIDVAINDGAAPATYTLPSRDGLIWLR